MTGAYLFGKGPDGKRIPLEVEYLTDDERLNTFLDREPDELLKWLNLLCKSTLELEDFLKTEGYSEFVEQTRAIDNIIPLTDEERESTLGSLSGTAFVGLINSISHTIVEFEAFLEKEGFVKMDPEISENETN